MKLLILVPFLSFLSLAKEQEKILVIELMNKAKLKSKEMYDSLKVGDSSEWITKGKFTYEDEKKKKFSCELTEKSQHVIIRKDGPVLHKYIKTSYEDVKGPLKCKLNFPKDQSIEKIEITIQNADKPDSSMPKPGAEKIEATCLGGERYQFSVSENNTKQDVTVNLGGNMLTLIDHFKANFGTDYFTRTIKAGPKIDVENLDVSEAEVCYQGEAMKLYYAAQKELGQEEVDESDELEEICL